MKRIFAIIASVAMIISLCSCSFSPNGELKKPSNVTSSYSSEVDNNIQDDQTSKSDTDDTSEVSSTESELPTDNTADSKASISELVLLDEKGVKITATGIDYNGMFGPNIKLLVENNSDIDLIVQARNVSVNGYMIDPIMSINVAKGKKANDGMTLNNSDLELCGIDKIADVEFSFYIFDSESWDPYIETQQIKLKTTLADTYTYSFDDSGDIAFNNQGIKIIVKGLDSDGSFLGPAVVVYIENSSEQNITVQARNVSINGFMVNPVFSSDVMVGKHAIDTITFMDSQLEENDISSINEIELSFHIFDSSNWDTVVDTDIVKITF